MAEERAGQTTQQRVCALASATVGESQRRSPAIGEQQLSRVALVDGTQGRDELPEARRGSTARWVCFSRGRAGGTTARHSNIPALGPWDDARRLAIKNRRTKCLVSRFGGGGSPR